MTGFKEVVDGARRVNSALTHALGLVRALGLVKKDARRLIQKEAVKKAKLVGPTPDPPSEREEQLVQAGNPENTQRLLEIFEAASKTKQEQ